MAPKKKQTRRLIQGRDWHGWACKFPMKDGDPEGKWRMCQWAEPKEPKKQINGGKWVRVKFQEIT